MKLRLGVLGSGKGSNLRAIVECINDGRLNAEVRLVLSDVANAGILDLARDLNIPAMYVRPGRFRTKLDPEVEQDMVRLLNEADVELVVLAGFMRILKGALLSSFAHRIINIHPSLLPKYPGLEAWKQALKSGEKETGCTVHYVDNGIDTGPIIAQKKVSIEPDDTPERLHARIQKAEHELLPMVIADLQGSAGG
ncbi:MAG: phosphoribosylglycinamide formyltransferase [Verrucomicrobia bacterium]|nr:phosphoribosylglycinamide formyltransferase [Verrucomicrobiota bacterium]